MELKLIEPLSRKLNHLGRSYISQLAKQLGPLGVSRYYYALTYICYHDGRLTQKALANELGKDKSLVVNIVDTLTEQGFVYRETNPSDRREHLLRGTAKGKKAAPHIIEAFDALNKSITANISEEELKIFNIVLRKMEANMKQLTSTEINPEIKS